MLSDLIFKSILYLKKGIYSFYSNNSPEIGTYTAYQPVIFRGEGKIHFEGKVSFGVLNSPGLHSTYAYLEARPSNALIVFGNNIQINNGFSVVSEHKITINNDVLIGYNCSITDSNFHNLEINKREETDPEPKEVIIERNVFIGNNVTILKGVQIGENSVVATGSIVTKSFPSNVVIGGNPAKIIRELSDLTFPNI